MGAFLTFLWLGPAFGIAEVAEGLCFPALPPFSFSVEMGRRRRRAAYLTKALPELFCARLRFEAFTFIKCLIKNIFL